MNKENQVKNSILYIFSLMLGNLVPIITIPIFTRILAPKDYGALALSQMYATFASGIANFGLLIGYERNFFECRKKELAAQLLYSVICFVLFTLLTIGTATYIFKSSISNLIIGNNDYENLLVWAFIAASIVAVKGYYFMYFRNMENAKIYMWYMTGYNVLAFVSSIYFIWYLRTGVVGIVWSQILGGIVVLLIIALQVSRKLPFSLNKDLLFSCFKISLPLTPRIFFGILGTHFNNYMIRLVESLGGAGIFSIGQKISYLGFSFMTAIENVFTPQVYRRMFDLGEEGRASIGKYLTPFFYISTAVVFGISLFSEEVIKLMTPSSYHGAIDIVTILAMFYGIMFFGKQPQLIFKKKTYILSLLTFSSIGINMGIGILFILKWGVLGAAWGTLAAGSVNLLISFLVSQHYYRIDWEYRKIWVLLVILLSAAISTMYMRHLAIDYVPRLAVKIAFLIGFAYVGVKFEILRSENLAFFKTFFRKKVYKGPPLE